MEKSKELQNLIDNNNVYFYDKIREDKRIVQFTESYEVAEQLGWVDNYVAISETEEGYDGVYLKGYAPKKSEAEIIEEAKLGKLKELSELTDKIFNSQKTYLTSSLGFRINAGSKAFEDINGLIILGDAVTDFNDFDDVIHELSVEQLEILQKEVIKSGQNIYQQKWAYRKQIENSQSVEEIRNIEFNFAMSDFKDKQQE